MADTASATAPSSAPAQASSPKKKSAASKKPRTKPAHPRTSEMVGNAIKSLKERGGSSLQAIKKYVAANYKVDAEKLAPFIKKYLKSAVQSGELVQTKGKGASGSFKLATSGASAPSKTGEGKATKRTAPAKEKKKKAAGGAKKPKVAAKKASVKKSTAAPSEKKKASAPAAPKAKKTPSKAKKVSKPPTKKPRAPKPKKAAPKPKTPKKTAPKKK